MKFWRQRKSEELDAEIRSHLDQAIRDRIERGETPEQARANAIREFGNVGLVKEVTREMWGWASLDRFAQDLRFGLRMLRKKPGFSLVAILTLALGIGANTAIFSVVNAVLLRPLPYAQAERLVALWSNLLRPGLEKLALSAPEFKDFKEQCRAFEQMAAYDVRNLSLTGVEEPELLPGAFVSPQSFALLGVQPALGRAFQAEEDQPGREQVAILSHALWQRRFGADAGLLGRSVTLDGKPVTVIGVMPGDFRFPENEVQVWLPLVITADLLTENNRGSHYLNVIARLKPDVTVTQAKSEVVAIAQRMAKEHAGVYRGGYGASVVPLHEEVVGNVQWLLLILFGAVGLVLLIACGNVMNLLLVRAAQREKEIAVRLTLGATRFRLIRQLLTESVLLSLLGGGLGLLLAAWGVRALVVLGPADIPRLDEIDMDYRALGFTLATSILTGLLFGLAPVMQSSRLRLSESLKDRRGASDSPRRRRLSDALVVAEFALALVLLMGAGLLFRSFLQLQEVKPGFRVEGLLSLRLILPQSKYPDFTRQTAFFQQAIESLDTQSGVESAGAISVLPLSGRTSDRSFRIEGRAVPPGQAGPDEELRMVSADYFRTMGIPLVKGRSFSDRDLPDSPRVALINEALKKRYWPDEEAIGKRIAFSGLRENKPDWCEIVGVVADVRHSGLDVPAMPEVYLPFRQSLFSVADSNLRSLYLVIRTAADPLSGMAMARGRIAALDKDQPLTDIRTMEQRLNGSIAQRRFNMLLLGLFAAVALTLAALGIYGVLSYAVTQRTREIGIRLALGAAPRDVLGLVLLQGVALVLAGVALGLIAALAVTRLLADLLYGVGATDAMTFIVIPLLLGSVALLACWIPARRATKVDPLIALRHE
ncbi:MAG TPA: ABC transporter permease [Blastocatellia bacterium]|jgi:putative ABC transport system permease protein|nr:ABC transporter permease [Blastocatellia bacterium]